MHKQFFAILALCAVQFIISGNASEGPPEWTSVDHMEKIINDFKETQRTYQRPTDNSRFKPADDTLNHFGSFDFIVVGSGSAGSALAARLSETYHYSVLLLEAGGEETEFSKIPAAMLALTGSPLDWGYRTVPQSNSCLAEPGRRCAYPRGLSLGGSSAINAMAYVRGNPFEYNVWGANHRGWSYGDLLHYFRKSEQTRMDAIDWYYHGYLGALHVERNQRHWLVDRLVSASGSAGAPYNSDYNGRSQLGSSPLQQTTLRGVRHSANAAYLGPIRGGRENLDVVTGAYVTKVLTEGPAAVGVEFSWNKRRWAATATKEVVLSAGAVNTPLILVHSGIGPADRLAELAVPLVADSPEVGLNLADHPALFSIPCTTNLTDADQSIRGHIADYVRGGLGNLATVVTHVIDFIQLDHTHGLYPDAELMLNPNNNALMRYLADPNYVDPAGPAATVPLMLDIITMVTHPKSRGSVRVVSADPYVFPEIDPNFLAHPDDLETMLNIVLRGLEILDTSELRQIDAKINWATAPGACGAPNAASADYWTCYIHHQTGSLFHPMGTCRMGDVVDARLRVKGVKNLRVADASVIPITVAGHTNPICIVIGEKAADLIKADWATTK